ncbi:MAG: glutamate-5-semialdehyde dehydrogenase [Bacteroidales bacterium]|jgi:glutamate-5-semialdehyde dehydrogenase|nr:glutamate-5-semialdehyde dehydrogenase [Bacteroidales bacterium]
MDTQEQLRLTAEAAKKLCLLDEAAINGILLDIADAAERNAGFILTENREDLARMDPANSMYDRLLLSENRIAAIASDIRAVAALPSPLKRTLWETTRPNGLHIRKVSVAFGVIGIIYEARPNVTFDVFSLCLKAGNACILKGGSDAYASNAAIVSVIHDVLRQHSVDVNTLSLLPAGRAAADVLLNARGFVDVIIPRGSQQLINHVRQNATIPVIETGAGICHTFVDNSANIASARDIVTNAKTRRPSVCNTLDCLIIHAALLPVLPEICSRMSGFNVIIYADEKAFEALNGHYPAELLKHSTPESFGTEFLSYQMAVKTVASLDEALTHIARYGSKHSESIVTEDEEHKELFRTMVDAAAVYCNASTAFTDGAQFGLGAEIGISTQKLHARGPMALAELTSYKWLIDGNGQTRP